MSDLMNTLDISAHGMKAQGVRLRIISQNIANADTTPESAGQEPYRRKVLTFRNVYDKEVGTDIIQAHKVRGEDSAFGLKFMPDHPAANEQGYVQTPNVNTLVEVMDMREAQRSYEANVGMMKISKSLLQQTLELMRG